MEEEILTFRGSSKLNLAAALRSRKQGNLLGQHKNKKWASPSDSSSSEEGVYSRRVFQSTVDNMTGYVPMS